MRRQAQQYRKSKIKQKMAYELSLRLLHLLTQVPSSFDSVLRRNERPKHLQAGSHFQRPQSKISLLKKFHLRGTG